MTDRIIARLHNQETELVQWLSLSNTTPSEPEQGSFQDLANAAQNSPVTLLLPASAVLLLAVELPIKSANQIIKALPFALEDLLANDVESYHLVWHRQPKGKVYVAAVSHDLMQTCLLRFQELGIELTKIYPETLCLPYQDLSCSILVDQQHAILRTGQWLGGGIESEFLPDCLDKLFTENPQFQAIQIWASDTAVQLPDAKLPSNITKHEIASPLQLLQVGATQLTEEFNLLSGRYGKKNTADWQWQKWLPAIAILLLAVLIQTGALLNSYWAQKAELATLETQTLDLFKKTFPEVKRIVNMKVQADQQLAELKQQGAGNGSRFMQLLYGSGEMLIANPSFQLRQLDFANDLLQLRLTASDLSQLEQYKQQLENIAFSVRILSAESVQNALEAQIEIRKE